MGGRGALDVNGIVRLPSSLTTMAPQEPCRTSELHSFALCFKAPSGACLVWCHRAPRHWASGQRGAEVGRRMSVTLVGTSDFACSRTKGSWKSIPSQFDRWGGHAAEVLRKGARGAWRPACAAAHRWMGHMLWQPGPCRDAPHERNVLWRRGVQQPHGGAATS